MKNIDELYYSAIESKPVNMDWSEGFAETWDFIDATQCDGCDNIVCGSGYAECEQCGTETLLDGPMMNYAYPVDTLEASEEQARKLINLPLCIVTVNDKTHLALTGGGMDLSWEICEAFMRLGYLPPVHFADLPAMAGRGTSDRDRHIIAACRTSVVTRVNQAARTLERLNELEGNHQPHCPLCETKLDVDGYCVDVGCLNVGKVPEQ